MRLSTKIINRLKYWSFCFILKGKNFKVAESIIIFSEARGGSTWLMELLGEILDVAINWEPLHVSRGVVPSKLNLGWKPYIKPDDTKTSYKRLFTQIFEYRRVSKWTAKYLAYKELLNAKQVLTKFVRANLLVPYLVNAFNFKHLPIFLMRHPIDTCLSQMRAFVNHREYDFENSIPEWVNSERFNLHRDFLDSLKSPLERKIAGWCLNNCEVINNIQDYPVYVLFYSELLTNPKEELRKLLKACRLEKYISKLDTVNFKRASTTAIKGEYQKSEQEQLHKNFEKLDETTKASVQRIFDYFEFTLYTAYSPFPKKSITGRF